MLYSLSFRSWCPIRRFDRRRFHARPYDKKTRRPMHAAADSIPHRELQLIDLTADPHIQEVLT